MYADRYAFDPADGVRAVHELRVASKCYAELGLRDDATRVELLASNLAGRVEADYASSRNILANALASEQWRVALVEARRLLRFTAHLPAGRYVEWLQQMLGKAASRASHQP